MAGEGGVSSVEKMVAFIEDDAAEAAGVDTGLESLRVLAEMDRQKSKAGVARWRPSLWTPS